MLAPVEPEPVTPPAQTAQPAIPIVQSPAVAPAQVSLKGYLPEDVMRANVVKKGVIGEYEVINVEDGEKFTKSPVDINNDGLKNGLDLSLIGKMIKDGNVGYVLTAESGVPASALPIAAKPVMPVIKEEPTWNYLADSKTIVLKWTFSIP